MSGPKAAEVRLQLGRALDSAARQKREVEANAARYGRLAVRDTEASRLSAKQLTRRCATALSADLGAAAEIQALRTTFENLDRQTVEADRQFAEAERLRLEAAELHSQSEAKLRLAQSVTKTVEGWLTASSGHELYEEQKQAAQVQELADEAVKREGEAAQRLQAAADCMKTARTLYATVLLAGRSLDTEIERIKQLTVQRDEAERISAADQRQAVAAKNELESLCRKLAALDHEKLAPGKYTALHSTVDRVLAAFQRSDYATAQALAQSCLPELRDLAQDVATRQAAREQSREAAAGDLEMAGLELTGLDSDFVARWSGAAAAVHDACAQLRSAQQSFDNGDYEQVRQTVGKAVGSLRALRDQAIANKARSDERSEIADAIMNTLYEQGYDAPTYRLAGRDTAGGEDPLSELAIFAKYPGPKGDMRLRVDLAGHVGFSVENVAEGEEAVCRSLVEGLRKGLGGAVDFTVTDWGRAGGRSQESGIRGQETVVRSQEKSRTGQKSMRPSDS